MATGIRICKEFGLKYVLVHGTEGHLIPDLLAQDALSQSPAPASPTAPSRSWPTSLWRLPPSYSALA